MDGTGAERILSTTTTGSTHQKGFTQTVGFTLAAWLRLLSAIFLSNIIWNLLFGILGDKFGWRRTVAICGGFGSTVSTLLLYYVGHGALAITVDEKQRGEPLQRRERDVFPDGHADDQAFATPVFRHEIDSALNRNACVTHGKLVVAQSHGAGCQPVEANDGFGEFTPAGTHQTGEAEDLAALASELGGDRINVNSIARGYQDPHFVEPKPSFVLKLQKADLLVVIGLQLEIERLHARYAHALDEDRLEDWPGFFTVSGSYRIVTAENHAAGLPLPVALVLAILIPAIVGIIVEKLAIERAVPA